MALTYKNLLRGHVVSVPEPADIIAAAEAEAERLFRKGTKRDRLDAELIIDKAQSQAHHQRQTLAKMDESRRWERYVAPSVEPEPEPEKPLEASPPLAVKEAPRLAQKSAPKLATKEPETEA